MKRFIINPGRKICGETEAAGAKNSALPIMAATILTEKKSIINRCPDISDVRNTVEILKYLGCEAEFSNGTATVDPTGLSKSDIPYAMMEEMRSSIIFLGALLARFKRAEISMPGGCDLGSRPIDLHISSLKKMGAEFVEYGGFLYAECQNLQGAVIRLPIASVGATENIMLAAVLAEGETVIYNSAREPEITDLANMLKKMGAEINGAGTSVIEIKGVKSLSGTEHTVIPDRIETTTLMAAACMTGGFLKINGVNSGEMEAVIDIFEKVGAAMDVRENSILVRAPRKIAPIPRIMTAPYPGFPTDCQPIITSMLTIANGVSLVSEKIFASRFKYVSELYRMGAEIFIDEKTAVVLGNSKLTGAQLQATDLRGGAAVVLAALAAAGQSEISNIHHIERGYEDIHKKLCKIGADIILKNDE